MNTLKLLTATAILTAATSAFAGSDDGNVGPAWQLLPTVPAQITATQAAPAPAPAAAAGIKQAAGISARDDFLRQQQANSSGNN